MLNLTRVQQSPSPPFLPLIPPLHGLSVVPIFIYPPLSSLSPILAYSQRKKVPFFCSLIVIFLLTHPHPSLASSLTFTCCSCPWLLALSHLSLASSLVSFPLLASFFAHPSCSPCARSSRWQDMLFSPVGHVTTTTRSKFNEDNENDSEDGVEMLQGCSANAGYVNHFLCI
jgi:hypothetical protein